MASPKQPNRRRFISSSAKLTAAAAVTGSLSSPSFGFHNSVNDELKIGLIGCGGRGTGAVLNATKADSNSRVTALADAFSDRIDSCAKTLQKQLGDRMAADKDLKQLFKK